MPPPKKPKNGPTTVEQFLSKEELQVLGKSKRPFRREGNNASRTNRDQTESPGDHAPAGPSHRESSPKYVPVSGPGSTHRGDYEPESPESAGQRSSAKRQDNVLADSESERHVKDSPSEISPPRDFPGGGPPRLVRASSFTPSTQDAEGSSHSSFTQPFTSSGGGRILERLFAARSSERVLSESGSSFHDHPSWPHNLGAAPIGQPPVFSPDPRHTGLSYRLATSNTLASLMTRPAWIPFEHSRPMRAPGQSNMHLNLRPSSSLDIQGHKPAASFTSVQQQQQQQQQHLDGRSILASLSSNQMGSGSVDHLSAQGDEVFLFKSSPPSRAESCASSYLSSLMRQPLAQHVSGVCGGAATGPINPTNRTESAPVYLHPAFHLPPTTTSSVRKSNCTSSVSLISSPQPGSSCLTGLPLYSNAKIFSARTSTQTQSQDHTQALFRGSSLNTSISGSNSAGSINSSSSVVSDNSIDNKDDIHLLDLSLRNRHSEDSSTSSRDASLTSPPGHSLVLAATVKESQNDLEHAAPRYISSGAPVESDVSNNVTNPEITTSFLRALSEIRRSPFAVMEKPQIPASMKLTGLLTMNSGDVLPTTSSSLTVKDETGATAVPYALVPCKPEKPRCDSDADSSAVTMASPETTDMDNAVSIMKLLTQMRENSYDWRQNLHHFPEETIHYRQHQHHQQDQRLQSPADPHHHHQQHLQSAAEMQPLHHHHQRYSPGDVSRSNGHIDNTSSSSVSGGGNCKTTTNNGSSSNNGQVCRRDSADTHRLTLSDDICRPDDMFKQEPSDCKSPKEEGPLVSPSSCMQVLHSGSSGESSGGSAHLQAATSTTSEAGPGPHPHNFLLDVHGAGLGASPPSHMKQEIGGALPGNSIQAKLCQVCNDNASGFHYGVWSCEGCKAFFKRSIQGPVDYICPATNTCTIDKHRRKSCQACRLRRCYEVGMNKGSQRKERKTSTTTGGLKGKRCRADSSDSAINSTNSEASSFKVAKRSRSASILEALQKADLPVLESYHNHSLPATRVHLLNTLIKLADRELVYLINWAKHVPGYTCLTLSDQVHLIECCWMELLLLNCAFRSMEYEGRTLVFAPDFHLERQQWALTGMADVLEQVSAVSEQMVLYGLNKEELLLLQATVLVNAEVRHLDSFVKIQDMRQMILDVFMEVAGRHQGYGNLRHAPSILLLLTHIRQAGERGITYFQRLKMEGCVTFCDLLTEMLDAHNSSGERRRLQQQQHLHQQQPSQSQHQQQQQQQQHPSQHQPPHHQHQQQHP